MEKNQILIKLLSVGDPGVGKSCLIKRYCQGSFVNKYVATIGVDYGVKKVSILGRKVAANFFDLSGEPEYKDISCQFFMDSQAIILVFGFDSRASFQHISKWQATMKSNGLQPKSAVVFLVGNKSDQKKKEVDPDQARQLANKKGYEFKVVSASTGDGVNQLFQAIFTRCVQRLQQARKAIKT